MLNAAPCGAVSRENLPGGMSVGGIAMSPPSSAAGITTPDLSTISLIYVASFLRSEYTLNANANFFNDTRIQSATVVISADCVMKANRIYVSVEEDLNWKEVEEWIEEWMRKRRNNITMRLTVIYQKVFRDDLESSSDENVPAKGSKVRHRTIIHFF